MKDALNWMESNQLAEAEEIEHHQRELEQIASPIITRAYQAGAGGAPSEAPGGMPGSTGAGGAPTGGPRVEEVD